MSACHVCRDWRRILRTPPSRVPFFVCSFFYPMFLTPVRLVRLFCSHLQNSDFHSSSTCVLSSNYSLGSLESFPLVTRKMGTGWEPSACNVRFEVEGLMMPPCSVVHAPSSVDWVGTWRAGKKVRIVKSQARDRHSSFLSGTQSFSVSS